MVTKEVLSVAAVWEALEDVKDPEIPVISVVDLGLIRGIQVEDGRVLVSMTPTFLGCPAIDVMQTEIANHLYALGAALVDVQLVLFPPWSSDWITERGRAQLKAFGLAPPIRHNGLIQIIFSEQAACPHCGSTRTEQKNQFGATLCRALYYCFDCCQPFEQFKSL
jgi:ring-1,2-phenylacetyl-CoA epoxidase subunit PaaD